MPYSAYYKDIQFESREKLLDIQNSNFISHFKFTAANSPYYKDIFKKIGFDTESIKSVKDICKLPLTSKDDINKYNKDFQAVPDCKIVDICLTSATTGNTPTKFMLTDSDIKRLTFNEEVSFNIAGLNENDTLLVGAALGRCFMAGLAYFLGSVSLGCRTVRAGSGSASQIWELIKVTECTGIVAVPSLTAKIAEYAIEKGEDPSKFGIKKIIGIGESLRDSELNPLPLASRIEKLWNADILSTYASTELSTTFAECSYKQGGHIRPELIVVEIIDENGNNLPDGEKGEVVVTPLGVTGMPLLRFKTGDISFIIDKECDCGRKSRRLGPILGRKKQMLKYKGTTIFPNHLLSIMEGNSHFYGGFIEAHKNPDNTDRIIMYAALNSNNLDTNIIEDELRAKARVVPEIKIISKNELDAAVNQPGKRKRIQFFDMRNK
jgi:phenylacetate-CoA ligase